ncbi:prenyltransferase [Bradyrhizobium sp. GCM10027634]|uniref:prenyltransferase n=1 Tax=unclassified Bradyrhizobium TaxID=2631580 RepID=UPI00188D6F2B|nr:MULTISPECIES: prenyltransferase [unclassified Bradyrhizobium]MDN5000588.1 prenyltransferase [Bradyrhizobium sp. WYCCWR 12677]QOZ48514.1 prenyltransferase [Bradyrhizobium sp. CCBAU 53340]
MLNGPSPVLSSDEIAAIVRDAVAEGQAGRQQAASQKIQPLRMAQRHQTEAAKALSWIVGERSLAREEAADVISEIADAYDHDTAILSELGLCLEAVRDIDDLNAAAPAHPIFRTMVEKLDRLAGPYEGKAEQEEILRGLATAARMMARQRDTIAEGSLRKLTEINPRKSAYHYNLGLFYKTRGRFAEGVTANRAAVGLSQEVIDSYEWNLGICATGAGNAETALDVWKRMGQKIELGRFGLPEGEYFGCKVRLAERPLAERAADLDDPGDEETVWIERLSPCHGIVRSVLYRKLGVDYGDVILMDGAPITYHTYGEQQIPVFPHLATLLRRNYRFFDFAGTQQTARQLADMSEELEGDSVIYSHSESMKIMCANCWRNPDINHADHEKMEKHVVTGRIAASPDIAPARLLDLIDQGIAKRENCQLYAPDLCAAAGQLARERTDRRRFALLTDN